MRESRAESPKMFNCALLQPDFFKIYFYSGPNLRNVISLFSNLADIPAGFVHWRLVVLLCIFVKNASSLFLNWSNWFSFKPRGAFCLKQFPVIHVNILDIPLFIPFIQFTEEMEFKTDPCWLYFYSNVSFSLLCSFTDLAHANAPMSPRKCNKCGQ